MNPSSWPFLFDLGDLKPQTQSYLKRLGNKLCEGEELVDQVFSRSQSHHLRKRGLAPLLLIGAMAKDGRIDHLASQRYSISTLDAARALVTLDVPLLINLEPGVDWQTLLRTATKAALDGGLYDWYVNPNEYHQRYASFEVDRIGEVVSIRACASLHSHADDNLSGYMPFDISKAIFGFGTELPELFRAISWFKSWEAAERAKEHSVLAGSWKAELITAMTNRYAFFWHLQGHSVPAIVSYLRSVLPEMIQFCIPTADVGLTKLITDVRVAHFLSAFPDHWGMEGFCIEHLLGVPYGTFEGERDYALHSLAEGVISREGSDYQLQEPIIKHLSSIDPRICSAEHVDRLGTRQLAWTDRVVDWTPAADKLNAMLQQKVWHPALQGLNAVDLLEGEASAAAALSVYLEDGGNGNAKRAISLIERYPHVIDAAFPQLKKRKEISRLAAIVQLTSDQIQQLPARHREAVFTVDLGL